MCVTCIPSRVQIIVLPDAQYSWDSVHIHSDTDQNEAFTEDE